jgi:predicted nucleic acid-binding protein
MAVYFIDSSALVKRYVNEIDSAWVLGLFNPVLNNEILLELSRESRLLQLFHEEIEVEVLVIAMPLHCAINFAKTIKRIIS